MKYLMILILIICEVSCRKQSNPPVPPPVDVEVMVYATPAQDTTTVVASTQTIQLQVR